MPQTSVAPLVSAWRSAQTLEPAVRILMEAMADEVEAARARFTFGKQVRLLRGLVHLRPADGYRGLVVHEFEQGRAAAYSGATLAPSSTAWRFVSNHGVGVAVDVHKGTLRGLGGGPEEELSTDTGPDAFQSAAQISARQSSHLLVLPVMGVGGQLTGVVSLEAACLPAVGKPFLWEEGHEALQTLVDLAAPYLAALPLEAADTPLDPLLPVVGEKMRGLIRLLRVFARQRESLLIRGPTGAGKSRLARWVHAHSDRRDGPFEAVDLQTVPEDMQMPTLFGWVRGAFTGATADNPGCVARAAGGTLFLDEIDKLSMSAQAGLLQLLEERKFRVMGRAGGLQSADVRFVIGSNADLEAAVKDGRFREDLLFRINVLPVALPSLDARRDEIPDWASFLLARHAAESGGDGPSRLAAGTSALLQARSWPGNLRQLDNVLRRAYAMALADVEDGVETTSLQPGHVELALAFETASSPSEGLLSELGRAAHAFAAAAQVARTRGGTLPLDHADAFRGLVLQAAEALEGNREAGFRLVGRGALVESRNHQRIFKREMARVKDLAEALGEDFEPG